MAPKRRRSMREDPVKKWEWEEVPPEISPKQSPPSPPGIAPHKYGTRRASLLTQCVANASLRSKRAQRIVPRPNEINTANSENLPLAVEHQTEATNHATEEVHNAMSSTSKRSEKETSKSADAHPTRSDNFNLTEILQLVDCNDDEEVDSTQNPLLVNLDGGYKVKAETVPVIRKIFERYGDIVKGSTPQSVEYRSSCLESVVRIYQRLDTVNLLDIALWELESMLNVVNDLRIFKVEVGWLRDRIMQIHEAKKFILKEALNLKAKKNKTLQGMEEKKTAIADTKRELEVHVDACRVLYEKLKQLEDDVGSAGIEIQKIDESYSSVKAKVKSFYQRPLVRDLL